MPEHAYEARESDLVIVMSPLDWSQAAAITASEIDGDPVNRAGMSGGDNWREPGYCFGWARRSDDRDSEVEVSRFREKLFRNGVEELEYGENDDRSIWVIIARTRDRDFMCPEIYYKD